MGKVQWGKTNIQVEASKAYDFSYNVNVPKAGGVTVKVQKLGDDNTFFVADKADVFLNKNPRLP